MPDAKPSPEPVPFGGGDADFKVVYRDWQAIRIIRDNYFENWRMFYTACFWCGATMFGAAGYIISNRPFQKHDALIVGSIGSGMILSLIAVALVLFVFSKRQIQNIQLIIERDGDASFLEGKVMRVRGAVLFAAGGCAGLCLGLVAWVYLFFFYYSPIK